MSASCAASAPTWGGRSPASANMLGVATAGAYPAKQAQGNKIASHGRQNTEKRTTGSHGTRHTPAQHGQGFEMAVVHPHRNLMPQQNHAHAIAAVIKAGYCQRVAQPRPDQGRRLASPEHKGQGDRKQRMKGDGWRKSDKNTYSHAHGHIVWFPLQRFDMANEDLEPLLPAPGYLLR